MGESDATANEEARRLFAGECRFIGAASSRESMLPVSLPEVAFVGRSNVGKSSLVNALTGRNSLARVSKSPCATKTINFFDLGGRLMLVDLPGYGYAQVGRTRAKVWARFAEDYVRGRVPLRRICLLIDSRVGLKDSDEEMMKRLDDSAVSYQIVMTKADEPSKVDLAATQASVAAAAAKHVAAHPEIIVTSSSEGSGIETLRTALAALAAPKGLPSISVKPRR
jgi:GTP-binding protein